MIRKGSKVRWKWGNGEAVGKVAEADAREVTKTIKGSEISPCLFTRMMGEKL